MTAMTMEGHMGKHVDIDVCTGCQAFWFDQYESLQLSAGATLKLMKFIGEHSAASKPPPLPEVMRCPRCTSRLRMAHDVQRNVHFWYWRCGEEHGRFIIFLEFLKEKNFVRPLSPAEIQQLRKNIQFVNCANCGASVNLETDTACSFCHSPISMLDLKHPEELLAQLKEAAAPKAADPKLPLKLIFAKLETETSLGCLSRDAKWMDDAGSSGLVQAGLNVVGRWLDQLAL